MLYQLQLAHTELLNKHFYELFMIITESNINRIHLCEWLPNKRIYVFTYDRNVIK